MCGGKFFNIEIFANNNNDVDDKNDDNDYDYDNNEMNYNRDLYGFFPNLASSSYTFSIMLFQSMMVVPSLFE